MTSCEMLSISTYKNCTIKQNNFNIYCRFLFICVCTCTHRTLWSSQDNLSESFLSFHHMNPRKTDLSWSNFAVRTTHQAPLYFRPLCCLCAYRLYVDVFVCACGRACMHVCVLKNYYHFKFTLTHMKYAI